MLNNSNNTNLLIHSRKINSKPVLVSNSNNIEKKNTSNSVAKIMSVLLSHRKTFWTSSNRPYERAIIPPFDVDYDFFIPTVRNSSFNLPTTLKFHRLVHLRDLPIHFDLARHSFLRYRAAFYGVQFNTNLFSYNLWLTMGLKKMLLFLEVCIFIRLGFGKIIYRVFLKNREVLTHTRCVIRFVN